MIITHFNRYFQKHGRITYIILGLIISIIFVIFVTPGDVFSSSRGRSDFGEMYGKTLKSHIVTQGMQETQIALALKYPQILGQNLSNDILFQQTLMRMRALHEAKKLNLTKVSDEEIVKAIHQSPLFMEQGAFSMKAMKNFLGNYVRRNNMNAKDFDRIVKENIMIDRLEAQASANCQADPAEVASYIEKYKVQFAEYPVDIQKDSRNSKAEIQNFFSKRSKDIKMPATKSAYVATFSAKDVKARLNAANCPAELKKSLVPAETEIKKQYNQGKDSLYKGQNYAQAAAHIKNMLTDQNIRRYLNDQASKLTSKFAAAGTDSKEAARRNRFNAEAMKLKANITITDEFYRADSLENKKISKAIAEAILRLEKTGEISSPVSTIDGVSVAMLKSTAATPVPGKLDDYLEELIDKQLTEEKAMDFYKETVKPFAAIAPTTRTYGDLAGKKISELQNNLDMTEEAKQNAYREYQMYLQENVFPFYRPEKRRLVLAAFSPDSFKNDVKVTKELLQAAYDDNKDEYQKKEVKLAKIELTAKASDSAAVKAKKAVLAGVVKKIAGGESFENIARKTSENKNVIDQEFVDVKSLQKELAEASAKLQKGQVSPVITAGDKLYMIKMLDRRDGRTLEMVRKELTEEVIKKQSAQLAQDAAIAFADKASTAWWDNKEKAENTRQDAEKMFKDLAAGNPKCRIENIGNVTSYGYFSPSVGQDQALAKAAFALTAENPVSAAVKGTKASYVAFFKSADLPFIVDPVTDKIAKSTLDRVYRRKVAMETARKRAEADSARIQLALKKEKDFSKAAAPVKFSSVPEFDRMGSQNLSQKTSIADPNQTLMALSKINAGSFISAQKSYMGYVLIYLESKKTPNDKDALSMKENIENYLKTRNERQAIARLYNRLEKESNTKLPEGLLGK